MMTPVQFGKAYVFKKPFTGLNEVRAEKERTTDSEYVEDYPLRDRYIKLAADGLTPAENAKLQAMLEDDRPYRFLFTDEKPDSDAAQAVRELEQREWKLERPVTGRLPQAIYNRFPRPVGKFMYNLDSWIFQHQGSREVRAINRAERAAQRQSNPEDLSFENQAFVRERKRENRVFEYKINKDEKFKALTTKLLRLVANAEVIQPES